MTGITWEDMPEPVEPSREPCKTGPAGHVWHLTIDEGAMGLTSGCEECAEAILGPIGGEDVFMLGAIVGKLVFNPDHPNLGGWHGLTRCDCGWTWNFVSERIEPEATGTDEGDE